MKPVSEKTAVQALETIRKDLRQKVSSYETRAKDCGTCEVQGFCCTDSHFVNVHISRLEAMAMLSALEEVSTELADRVRERNSAQVRKLRAVPANDTFSARYSCPLFEPGIGCLVHETAKPLPCIHHACYENAGDLPPDELLEHAEQKVSRINARLFGNAWNWQPIPVWLESLGTE